MSDHTAIAEAAALFDIPSDVTYLAAAGWTPQPRPVRLAVEAAAVRKTAPWRISRETWKREGDDLRARAGALVNAPGSSIAIVNAVSYAMATAARNLRVDRGSRVLILAGEHPSNALEWIGFARAHGAVLDVVPWPGPGGWTAAILDRIAAPGAPVGLASLCPVHWADGGSVDLDVIAPALRAAGGRLVIDATQAVGVLPVDVARWDPDFLAFPLYKWLFGPAGCAFLYVAPRHQGGAPLEQHSYGRQDFRLAALPDLLEKPHVETAARFDAGEQDHFIRIPAAAAALEFVGRWDRVTMAAMLQGLTTELATRLRDEGLEPAHEAHRAPHILGMRLANGASTALVEFLASRNVYADARRGMMRFSPHIYTSAVDLTRCVDAVRHWGSTSPC